MYVRGNPVMLVDPNGMWDDEWNVNIKTGEVTHKNTNGGNETQTYWVYDGDGNMVDSYSARGSRGSAKSMLVKGSKQNGNLLNSIISYSNRTTSISTTSDAGTYSTYYNYSSTSTSETKYSDGIPYTYNQNVSTAINGANGTFNMFSTATATTLAEFGGVTKGVSGLGALSKLGNYATGFGAITSIGLGFYEYRTGTANTHTIANVGVSIAVTAAAIFAGPAVIAGAAGLGLIYGLGSAMGFDEVIDDWTGDWGKEIFDKFRGE